MQNICYNYDKEFEKMWKEETCRDTLWHFFFYWTCGKNIARILKMRTWDLHTSYLKKNIQLWIIQVEPRHTAHRNLKAEDEQKKQPGQAFYPRLDKCQIHETSITHHPHSSYEEGASEQEWFSLMECHYKAGLALQANSSQQEQSCLIVASDKLCSCVAHKLRLQ